MIGKRISGRYEILKFIGGGGMSRVYLAHDIILDRDVAIKVLNYDFSNEEELKRRFMREALSATSLTHPHIVDIYDVGEDGDIHYLVMQFVEGQTLKEYITSNGPLTPEQALPIMRQLVSAISNAHYNGIVHRDIKPQNILMDHDGNVIITDFGIAMALSATAYTKTNSVLGTVHYLSPEQARGGMATKKSDIYSLGIVFYELLTGKLPFSGESAVSIALKHLQEETPSVRKLYPTIPQSVENVILKATAKDAASRYKSADEMQDDLATVLLPERANEERFVSTFDDETTRAIPAITAATSKFDNVQQTKENQPVTPVVEQVVEPVKKKRKKWPIVVGILVGLAAIALLIVFLPGLLGLNKIEVPDVSDYDEREAVDVLEEKGFIVAQDKIEQTSDEFEAGKVIRTVPEAKKERRPGTEITLYISTGKEMAELVDYTGQDIEQVIGIVENVFKSIKIEEVFDDEISKGTIIKQSPEAGPEFVLSETDIIFTVSKGKELVTLENLVGYDKQKIQDYAKSSGLNIDVRYEHHATVGQGRIISQNPAAETQIEKGSRVEVVESLGQEQKPIKQLIHTVTIQYVPEEPEEGEEVDPEAERKPNRIRIYIGDRKNSIADVFSDFTITEDTARRITIELEDGQSGSYLIMRDDEQVAKESFNYDDAD